MIDLRAFLIGMVLLTLMSFGIGVGVGYRMTADAVDACLTTSQDALDAVDAARLMLDAGSDRTVEPQITEEVEP